MRILQFQLTPSRRATATPKEEELFDSISTHALTEGDHAPDQSPLNTAEFQLTPSRRATTTVLSFVAPHRLFQLTPSRRATLCQLFNSRHRIISTHALTEGDGILGGRRKGNGHFNSRPHGGRRRKYFYNRSPGISTHALTEGDFIRAAYVPNQEISTHALTEGDNDSQSFSSNRAISTHALTEGDSFLPCNF